MCGIQKIGLDETCAERPMRAPHSRPWKYKSSEIVALRHPHEFLLRPSSVNMSSKYSSSSYKVGIECDYLFFVETAEADKVAVELPKKDTTTLEEPREVKNDDVKPIEEGMEKLNVEESKKEVVEEKATNAEEKYVTFRFCFAYFQNVFNTTRSSVV